MKTKKCFVLLFVFSLMTSFLVGSFVDAAEKLPAEIKIGITAPYNFAFGTSTWQSAQIAADEINANGGIAVGSTKLPVKIVKVETNEYLSVTDAAAATSKAVTLDKIKFLLGSDRSEAILAMQDICATHKAIFIHSGLALQLTNRIKENYDRYKYCFRGGVLSAIGCGATYQALAVMVKDAIVEQLGIKTPKVAILGERGLWVDPIINAAKSTFPQYGMEIVGVWRIQTTASDLTAELTAIKNSGAHMIYTIMGGTASVPYVKAWQGLKIPAASVGCNLEALHKEFYNGSQGSANYETVGSIVGPAAVSDKALDFWNEMVRRFNAYPIYTAGVYDPMMMLKAAIEKAGSLDTDAIVANLEQLKLPLVNGTNYYGKEHDLKFGVGYVTGLGLQWQQGNLKVVWPRGGNDPYLKINLPRYKGTVDYQLPPWMVSYWKSQKK